MSKVNIRTAAIATSGTLYGKDGPWGGWLPRDFGQNDKIWVINPMHIVTLSTHTKSKFVKAVDAFKRFSEKWFSHVLLLGFLILYGFLGAYIFQTLEAPLENNEKASVTNMREKIIRELWWSSQRFGKGWWEKLAYIRMKEFEKQLQEACIAGVTTSSEQKVWTFWGALFFSSTIFTTIGYGNVVPKTNAGRVATIIYAFIGIPLLLMVLTDLGKLFTRGIKRAFKYCRMVYYTRSFRRVRTVGRKATAKPSQYMMVAIDAMNRRMSQMPNIAPSVIKPNNRDSNVSFDNKVNENRAVDVESNKNGETQKSKEKSKDKKVSKSNVPAPRPTSIIITTTDPTPPQSATIGEEPPQFEVDDEFNLPISVAVLLLFLYMMIGAAFFTISEKWSFFESFYFIYISLSTIGFGDYVPNNPFLMICTFIYLLFGLALTSMCINVVQEKLSASFQKAKMTIGATMGLDVQEIMAEDLASEQKEKSRESSADKLSEKSDKESVDSKKSKSKDDRFSLQEHGIGSSLKERREKRRSPIPETTTERDESPLKNVPKKPERTKIEKK